MRQAITLNNKIIGYIDFEKEVYISSRTKEHQFRIFGDGFGISEKVLDYLLYKEIKHIIINLEERVVFWVDVNSFIANSHFYNFNGDIQFILPLKFWKTENDIELNKELEL